MILFQPHLSGVSGDMLLGALLGLGAREELLHRFTGLEAPGIRDVRVQLLPQNDGTLPSTSVLATCEETAAHRHPEELRQLLHTAGVHTGASASVLAQAEGTLDILVQAEAEAHGQDASRVHLHEVGRFDTIFDVLGFFLLLEDLGDPEIQSTPPRTGTGFVQIEHGSIPVPVPAVRAIASRHSVPLQLDGPDQELTTPTGIALLASCAAFTDTPAPAVILHTGYGRGTRPVFGHPNVLPAHLLEETEKGRLLQMETVLDDITGEELSRAISRLSTLAREVACHPGTGKKGRPLWTLRILTTPEDFQALLHLLFSSTPTRGVRYWPVGRLALSRRTRVFQVETPEGSRPIRWKISRRGFHVLSKPESDDLSMPFDPYV